MPDATNNDGSPTVVLVHGAFADASSWNGVIERLQGKGVQVKAPANPLRGIANDSAYIATVFDETPGGGDGATGRQHVVDEQGPVTRP